MNELRLVAPFHNISGYANLGRFLLGAAQVAGLSVEAVEIERREILFELGVDGSVSRGRKFEPMYPFPNLSAEQAESLRLGMETTVSKEAPLLIVGNPTALYGYDYPETSHRIGLTMAEAAPLYGGWQRGAENVDTLLVPSRWNEHIFKACKYPHVRRLSLGSDERVYTPQPHVKADPPMWYFCKPDRPKYLFVSVFSTCERKNWEQLLTSFTDEFRGEDVGLLVKPTSVKEVEQLAAWCRMRGAWVQVVEEKLSDAEMAEFYSFGDCYVLPSTEGFGLPFVEAAMCGVQSVGLGAGGSVDPLCDLGGFMVDAHAVPVQTQLYHVYRGANHFVPQRGSLRRKMREAYEKHTGGDLFWTSERLRSRAVSLFGREAIGRKLKEIIEGGKPARAVESRPIENLPLAVVMTTHNHLEETKEAVAALKAHSPAARLVLVDDNSTDGTREWAEGEGLTLLRLSRGNVASNRQEGVRHLVEEGHEGYVAFMDNDVRVTAGWWDKIRRVFEERWSVGIVAPAKYLLDGTLQNIGNRLTTSGNAGELSLHRDCVICDYVESACMVVRPDLWQAICWDPQFPIFYEDTDYCYAARQLGYDVAATGGARVWHNAHQTSRSRENEARQNRVKFLKKWEAEV